MPQQPLPCPACAGRASYAHDRAKINRRAGEPVQPAELVDVSKLLAAYADRRPDPAVATQRVAFGTSGHRGSSFDASFNEAHVLAISQAICLYRRKEGIDGPLFLGIDTHALSLPAFEARSKCWRPTASR